MKWFVIIFFASWHPDGTQDIFVFQEPAYNEYLVCRQSLVNPDEIEMYVNGLMRFYKGILPGAIEKVDCIDETKVQKLFEIKQRQEGKVHL